MTLRVALNHSTEYFYDREVVLGPQVIRLRPAPHGRTPVDSYSLKIEPAEHFINWQYDPQGNHLARLVFPKPTNSIKLVVELVADMTPINPFDYFLEESAEYYPIVYSEQLKRELHLYFQATPTGARFQALYEQIDQAPQRTNDFINGVNQLVNRSVEYSLRMLPGVYPPEQLLAEGVGSCRDFAWLLVHLYRRCGLAARLVSGYSIQLVSDVKPTDPNAPAGVSEDTCDLHAWCEVYLPGAGWIGLDATSGLMCGEGYIPLAAGADIGNVAPIEGTASESRAKFDVSMSISRIG